jgi:tRNA threonylcarbamoyladenosine biosynthesis protein TsaE
VGGVTAPLELATADAEGTQAVAAAIAGYCAPGDVLLLVGDLGAGKTTFAQGFGRALGIVESITSPTFTLVRQYPVTGSGPGGVECLIHADVYRLEHLQEVTDLGIGELVEDGGVALVEWGDAAAPVLGAGALTVQLQAGGGTDGTDLGAGTDEVGYDLDQPRWLRLTADPDDAGWGQRWPGLTSAVDRWVVR